MTPTNFVLLGLRDRRYLAERVAAAIGRWQVQWCVDGGQSLDVALCDRDAVPRPNALRWHQAALPGGFVVAIGMAPNHSDSLVAVLLGNCQPPAADDVSTRSEIEITLETAALEALLGSVLHDLHVNGTSLDVRRDATAPGDEIFDQHKGYVAVRACFSGLEVFVVLSPAVTAHLLRTRPAVRKGTSNDLATLAGAISDLNVTLETSAGIADLTLSELATLSVGDVIALRQRLEQPVSVKTTDGRILFSGYLGVYQGRRAVQLTILNSNDGV